MEVRGFGSPCALIRSKVRRTPSAHATRSSPVAGEKARLLTWLLNSNEKERNRVPFVFQSRTTPSEVPLARTVPLEEMALAGEKWNRRESKISEEAPFRNQVLLVTQPVTSAQFTWQCVVQSHHQDWAEEDDFCRRFTWPERIPARFRASASSGNLAYEDNK
jgi:hypothetical protein